MSSHSIFSTTSISSASRIAAYVSLSILAIYLFEQGLTQPLPRVEADHSQTLLEKLEADPGIVTKSEIISWSLFGSASAAHRETKKVVRESNLNFKVNGIILDSKARMGWAILSNDSGEEKLYTTGDKINKNTKIEEIQRDAVIINNSGTFESLQLSEFDSILSMQQPTRKNSTLSEDGSKKEDAIDPNASKRERLLKYFSLTPVEPGSDLGYRVSEQSKKLIEDYDLKPGDIILSANGYPLGTESADMAALQVFNNIGKAEVVISRDGASFSLSYPQ